MDKSDSRARPLELRHQVRLLDPADIELQDLHAGGLEVLFLRSRRYRSSVARLQSIAPALCDGWPAARRSLIAFAEK